MTAKRDQTAWPPIFWVIMVVALLLRLYHLAAHSIWYDEAASLYSIRFVDWNLTFLSSDESRLVPLYALVTFFWVKGIVLIPGVVLGTATGDFFVRLMPALFSLMMLPIAYRLSLILFNHRNAALAAVWFLAISPFQIYYAQELRPHSLYALLVTCAMYNAYRALEAGERRHWIGTVLFGTLSFYAYYFSAFYLVSINLYALICFNRYRSKILPWALSQLTILALIIPAGLMALFTWGNFASADEYWFPTPTLKHLALTFKSFLVGYSPNAQLYFILLAIAAVLVSIGIVVQRKSSWKVLFLFSMSVLPILLQIIAWTTQDFAFFTYRIQLAYAAPAFIAMGIGFAYLRPKAVKVITLTLFTLLTIPTIADYYNQNLHPAWEHRIGARHKADSRSAAQWVAAQWEEGDFIAHTATSTLFPFRENYFNTTRQAVAGFTDEERQGLLRSYPDEDLFSKLGFLPRRIEDIVQDSTRVWYVQSWWEPFDPIPLAYEYRAWLDAHLQRQDQREFDGINVYLYEPYPVDKEATPNRPVLTNGLDSIYHGTQANELNTSDSGITWFDEHLPQLAGNHPAAMGYLSNGTVMAKNLTQTPFSLSYSSYTSLDVVSGIGLNRIPQSDVWRPTSLYNGLYTMSARLSPDAQGTLQATRTLPPGSISVFIRIVTDNSPDNTNWGAITFSLMQNDISILETHLSAHDPDHPGIGWNWVKLGTMDSPGGEISLSITASNPANLEAAYFDIERIVFMDSSSENNLTQPTITSRSLPPGEWIELEDPNVRSETSQHSRVDWEFLDEVGYRYNLYR